MLLYVNKK